MAGFFQIGDTAYAVQLRPGFSFETAPGVIVAQDGDHIWIHLDGVTHELIWRDAVTFYSETADDSATDVTRAPMPGVVISVAVEAGAHVVAGETLLVIESMKLETAIKAPRDGIVETVHVRHGQTFGRDVALASLVPENS